ncbi:UNVERIFIED_CONTAM: TadE-like protein [Acetivibrio alkalicellulosi]
MCFKELLSSKKGQSIVETAMVLPIIVIILAGIIDFGLLFNNYMIITNASREAARSAAIGDGDLDINLLVVNMTGTLDQSKITTTIYPPDNLRRKGEEVVITIEYQNTLITPVISAIIPNPISLESKTIMRIE